MLLIYTPRITNRLGYTLNVMFRYMLSTEFTITTNAATFEKHEGAKLAYGPNRLAEGAPFVRAKGLLFETNMAEQELRPYKEDGLAKLFPTYDKSSDINFDPFAAAFYMLTRYEEYMPHRNDEHGRFMAQESIAYKEGFLQQAVVDRWALEVRDAILKYYPDYAFAERKYEFVETVDIDAAYCYKNKGLVRTLMGIGRDLVKKEYHAELRERLQVLRGKEADPFDTFDYILSFKKRHRDMHLIFFVLLGDYGVYDKPISFLNNEFQDLLKHLCDYAKIGIHPSYNSMSKPHLIDIEMERLSDIVHRRIVRSRFHFLRLQFPLSYRSLIKAGIKHDYTMGYADTPGYRAGTATPYPFYDLSRDEETQLTVHPFILMDTTLQKYMALKPAEAKKVIRKQIDEAKAVGSVFNCIWHNQNLCDLYGWAGWREVYEDMIEYGMSF
ncbi:MAG: polysaccharide deacetylase family protein [Bacteroidales bacterium]|nr:polysaccharide deacetylase family protein [Bacteroidales bacterium]